MKRILILMFALLWVVPGLVSAHSYIEESAPAKDETLSASPEQIEMTFNTDIEKLSSFKLYDEKGKTVKIGATSVNENVLSGPVTEPLENGVYTVKWAAIGEDGHSVSGEYSFTVAAADNSGAADASSSPSADNNTAGSDTPPPSPSADTGSNTADNSSSAASDGTKNPNMGTAITIGVIIIAAAVILILRSRKK
ncbi:copper resistance CopC family protein [Paenibacillus protaetiae]|uniref:copper resistance CopC family protein n=1 Tax=Paenibacillus protaetiae TaxID=2509456 RepID=UPI0013E9DA0D|nr:copper resistance CopC family protein [Paenibacillus protaetiae]